MRSRRAAPRWPSRRAGPPLKNSAAGASAWPPVPRLWDGETAVLIAGGPSLTAAQCAWAAAADVHILGVNNAYLIAPRLDALYACDLKWWEAHPAALALDCIKVSQDARVTARWPEVKRIAGEDKPGLSLEPGSIHFGANGGYQALNLAVLLGARRILLLGYDMRVGHGGRPHWHGLHGGGLNNPADSLMRSWMENFRTTPPDLERASVEVINCTPGSALDAFPMARLEDVL